MGNALATVLGSLVGFYYKLLEKTTSYKSSKNEFLHTEILLKDEENQAGSLLLY